MLYNRCVISFTVRIFDTRRFYMDNGHSSKLINSDRNKVEEVSWYSIQ